MPDDYTEGLMQAFGDPGLNEHIKALREGRQKERDLLLGRIESLANRWRHHSAGWDISGPHWEIVEGFESCLDLLCECHEELMGE